MGLDKSIQHLRVIKHRFFEALVLHCLLHLGDRQYTYIKEGINSDKDKLVK